MRCEVIERDRHGRLVAKVFSPNGVDIGRRLVSAGRAYRRYSMDYVDAEARKARRGMWRGTLGVARIVTPEFTGIHALGSGRDATAADGAAIFQLIGMGGRDVGPAVPVGQMAEDNIQARVSERGTRSIPGR